MFKMEDVLDLRDNPKVYTLFYKLFIPCVIKKGNWDKNVPTAQSDDEICTVSEEVFAILLVENSYDRWIDIFEVYGGHAG